MSRATSSALSCAALFGFTLVVGACGPEEEERLVGTFTSDIVQRDTCRVTGDSDRESCVRDEALTRLRVSIIEDDFDRAWLLGVTREGESDRRILGTRDRLGGFLFVERSAQVNEQSGCRFDRDIELSLRIDEGASRDRVGIDPCVPLIGRELRTFTTSAECDDINDPPEKIQRINRRRWEPAASCGAEE